MEKIRTGIGIGALLAASAASAMLGAGCDAPTTGVSDEALAHRAYVVSHDSDELTVIDLDRLEIIGRVHTAGVSNHMAELNRELTKIYVDSEATDETVVVDARTLEVATRIPTGRHPTHLSLSRDGGLLAVMDEDEGTGAVSFIDPVRDVEIKRLGGFATPHFMRFSEDGRHGYVANLGAYHLTRVDLASLAIDGHIALAGYQGPPDATAAPDQDGFADAQIDADGMLYAAHGATGKVLVYDTRLEREVGEVAVGDHPWIVYAEHPFAELRAHVVPNFGDRTASVLSAETHAVRATGAVGDRESFGVNYSPLAPDRAYVMNRFRNDIAVMDTDTGALVARIPTGGTTETASTTADGKWIVAAVSSSNQVVVIDVATDRIIKTFDGVGRYPWSVTIPGGQNYCH